MAHDKFCDYRPSHLMGIECICDFIDLIRQAERKTIANRIGVETLHQKGGNEFATCKGCRQWPCELDSEQ